MSVCCVFFGEKPETRNMKKLRFASWFALVQRNGNILYMVIRHPYIVGDDANQESMSFFVYSLLSSS